jgi:TonB family protein
MTHPTQDPNPHSSRAEDPSLARTRGLAHWLIGRAAQRAPDSLSQRLEEEWLAHMQSRPSSLSRLTFALGCCWATKVIAREHGLAVVASATPAVAGRLTVPYFRGVYVRHSTAWLLVAALHFAVFYALIAGLRNTAVTVEPRFQVSEVPAQHTREQITPPPPVTTKFKDLVIAPPEFLPPGYESGEQIYARPVDPTVPPLVPPRAVSRVPGGPGSGFPDTDDYYPPAAKRLEEQGIATVRVCVDAHGRLSSAPTLLQSAGSARLDEGALQLARAGSGHYRASTDDGRPVDSCYGFRIRFQLKN